MARSHQGNDGEAVGGTPADVPSPEPRSAVLDRLTGALTRSPFPTSLLVVDVDDFRMLNAARGHAVGDRLLVAVHARLAAAVSSRETVVRSGDDEFVVICEDTSEHSAYALACFLRNTLAEPFLIDRTAVRVTASIGVAASAPASPVPATDLLHHAESAVHAGKAAGRGQVQVYDQALGEDEASRYVWAADLPTALADGTLEVEYQRIVDLRTGALAGLEALARWRHPERGPVPPSSFVGVAELTGLAPQVDGWVVQRALRDMADLRRAGVVPADAYLAVNLSAAHLVDPHLVDSLATWTARWGLPANLLVVELTETAIMRDPHAASRLLRRLRERGHSVAMDDFGTGYSSLAHLRDLPISALKIDRSFVAEIGDSADALAIVSWIVDLARAVDVAVVAEGVETPEQAALLRTLGCPAAQGWLWGPAVPVTALLRGDAWEEPPAARRDTAAGPSLWPVGTVSRPAGRFSWGAGPGAVEDAR